MKIYVLLILLLIDESYDLEFIGYIVKELKISNDIKVLNLLYDSIDSENLLYRNRMKVLGYQYIIPCSNFSTLDCYSVSNVLDDEAKNYYLKLINRRAKI